MRVNSKKIWTPGLIVFFFCTLISVSAADTQGQSQRSLTFDERVSYERVIEEVYWRHRIWPKENSQPKPGLDQVMAPSTIRAKVEDYLRKSEALAVYWQQPITGEQLQTEMDRMARQTKQPDILRELWVALGNDPYVIAECLARPVLANRLIRNVYAYDERYHQTSTGMKVVVQGYTYRLPKIEPVSCVDDTWTPTSTLNAPDPGLGTTAVWTGSEMIVWGGNIGLPTSPGGRYDPATDSWTPTSTLDAPSLRHGHTAVWTGNEMIVWGGQHCSEKGCVATNTGARYESAADSWTPTSSKDAPGARVGHTAVWTGSEMIVWGGSSGNDYFNTGGRYDPATNSWTPTSTKDAPSPRGGHTAVLAEREMIVWGGLLCCPVTVFNTGGRYDPGTDSWTPTSSKDAPSPRVRHTAVWTGNEMIVWGSSGNTSGGRYDPATDRWTPTSTKDAPGARVGHTAVWTGSEMIVWAGDTGFDYFNTGARYNPATDTWAPTSTKNAPFPRTNHTAVWTGSEMIVWAGRAIGHFNTGGRYCASAPMPAEAKPIR